MNKRMWLIISAVMALMIMLAVSVSATNETEPNNSRDTATNISINTTVNGNLSSSSDVDWYKFTIPEDGYFYVDFQHELYRKTDISTWIFSMSC